MPRAHRAYAAFPITTVRPTMLGNWWRTLTNATLQPCWRARCRSRPTAQGRLRPRLVVLEDRWLPSAAVTADPPVNISRLSGNQVCTAIAVDPTNPQHLFAVANAGTGSALFAAFSVDGGGDWSYTDSAAG